MILKLLNKIKNKGKSSNPIYKQELLLRLALEERYFNTNELTISCDHILGKNYVNGIELGIKYPDSFYYEAFKLIPKEKTLNYYFNGFINESGKREELLKPFMSMPKSKIISSKTGRVQRKKDKFNRSYYAELAKAKFGLCPHHVDWIGNRDYMWTYRFIEACFVESIPILFERAPLGKKFINGFNYLWDNQIISDIAPYALTFDRAISKRNRELAKKRFCLTEEECEQISQTINRK